MPSRESNAAAGPFVQGGTKVWRFQVTVYAYAAIKDAFPNQMYFGFQNSPLVDALTRLVLRDSPDDLAVDGTTRAFHDQGQSFKKGAFEGDAGCGRQILLTIGTAASVHARYVAFIVYRRTNRQSFVVCSGSSPRFPYSSRSSLLSASRLHDPLRTPSQMSSACRGRFLQSCSAAFLIP